MPKKIMPGRTLYVANAMLGRMPSDTAEIYDEREEKLLNPCLTEDKIQIYERQVNGTHSGVGIALRKLHPC